MLIDRCTGEVDQITSASELLRCDGIARILTWDVWGGGKKSQKGLCYTSTIQAYTIDPRLAVSALPDGRNSKSGNALLLYLAACMVNRWATLKWCISLRLPNNESATYIRSGNNSRTNQWLPHFFFFFLYFFSFFYSFCLIVCNSYHISLRPTSVASNSAVGKPSVCCRHFIGFQGGGLLLFGVILARQ